MDDMITWLVMVLDRHEKQARDAGTDSYDPRPDLARIQGERGQVRLWRDLPKARRGMHKLNPIERENLEIAIENIASVLRVTLRWIAYGRRFDAPGWKRRWAPEDTDPYPPDLS